MGQLERQSAVFFFSGPVIQPQICLLYLSFANRREAGEVRDASQPVPPLYRADGQAETCNWRGLFSGAGTDGMEGRRVDQSYFTPFADHQEILRG